VSCGRNYDIPIGAPVIFAGGVVGVVSEVHAYTAIVNLISSPSVRLAAVIEGDARPISYQGGLNPTLASPRGIIEFVPRDISQSATTTASHTPKRNGSTRDANSRNAPARQLLTSGLGGVFPAGLRIGKITQLKPNADGLFQTGEVTLDPRLSELREVTILVPVGERDKATETETPQ